MPLPKPFADLWNKIKRDSSALARNISEDDIVVYVVGPTGSGKSWFTKEATKSDLIKVSRNQRPCTGKVKAIRCELTDEAMGDLQGVKNIVLVDTPAFLTGYNGLDARNAFMTWFDKTAYKPRYVGVIYMHRIETNPALESVEVHLGEFSRVFRIRGIQPPQRLLIVISDETAPGIIADSTIAERTQNLRSQVDQLGQSTSAWQPSPQVHQQRFHGEPEVAWGAIEELFRTE